MGKFGGIALIYRRFFISLGLFFCFSVSYASCDSYKHTFKDVPVKGSYQDIEDSW